MVVMAHDFCASDKRVFKANHTNEIEMKLVESALGRPILDTGVMLKAGDAIPDNAKVIGFDTMADPTHWFVGVKPEGEGAPALLEAAKAGEIAGFSWAGVVDKKAIAI